MEPLIIYHANCMDGFTAAWAAHKGLGGGELFPMLYDDEPPWEKIASREVYVVDFSFKRDVCIRMDHEAQGLLILDHHKTAEAELQDLPYAQFDMDRSGAGITWDTLCSGVRSWLIDYVEDRDLWRFKLDRSKEINAAVAVTPMTLESWDQLAAGGPEEAFRVGQGALAFEQMAAERAAKEAVVVDWEDAFVPFVNVPYTLASVTANLLCKQNLVPFAVGWFLRKDGLFQYSLRSAEGGWDVSEIAKKYGGGGHKHAAGFNSKKCFAIR